MAGWLQRILVCGEVVWNSDILLYAARLTACILKQKKQYTTCHGLQNCLYLQFKQNPPQNVSHCSIFLCFKNTLQTHNAAQVFRHFRHLDSCPSCGTTREETDHACTNYASDGTVPIKLLSHGVSLGETKDVEIAKIYKSHLKQATSQVPWKLGHTKYWLDLEYVSLL